MKAYYSKYILHFKKPSGTSRGILKEKETWFFILEADGKYGIGECGLLKGLSIDDVSDYEKTLQWACTNCELGFSVLYDKLMAYPSIQFGIEQAFLSLQSANPFHLFPSGFIKTLRPIPINGLIWMGTPEFMLSQIEAKLKSGFRCIKMKIGAINFKSELAILQQIRDKYSAEQIELRVDANGAFKPENANQQLKELAVFDLHSIEQPIRQGNHFEMHELCKNTPLPIALDEELIGIFDVAEKEKLLQTIQPQFIILKPSLVGGFKGCQEWITLAETYGIGWWITSALESNIGLNAIAQWTYTLNGTMPQGLGTGGLFTNNFESPLLVEKGNLYYSNETSWNTNLIENLCI